MFKYNNYGKFVNNINYPFNITTVNDTFVDDFWTEIDKLINQINNEKFSKIRYVWINTGNYCQAEIFLKDLLLQNCGNYPVLYLHCIDFIRNDRTVYHQLSQEQIDDVYFINNPDVVKICVIDHAETINQLDQYLELCRKLHNNKCIFIFLSKNDTSTLSYWKEIVKKASSEFDDHDCYLSIIRSEENYYVVKPYSHHQCKEIFRIAIEKEDIRNMVISIADTLEEELRRPYYFDHLIDELNKYEDVSQLPAKLDDDNFMLKIFSQSMDGISSHLKGFTTLREYIEGYYKSDFVKSFDYGEHNRIPFDNYICAYGIMYCSSNNKYEDIILDQFEYYNIEKNDFRAQSIEINERLVLLFYSEKKKIINNNFVLKDYFLQMIKHSIGASSICASVLNKCFEKIDEETREIIFKALGKRYGEILESKEDIFVHYLLGMDIGMLMPRVSNNCIIDGLGYFFKSVNDDYVEPKYNNNGISVIPVTNFEFQKFVKNYGYAFYSLNSDKPLNEIATKYYEEIFNFIISALCGDNRKDSNCLARLLKGYGGNHYKQIAYLFSRKEDIDSTAIYDSIGVNYPDKVSNPAKWENNENADMSRPFCNPLQPVVCVNIFEARAYANWLSTKINKPVRLLIYDPDYLSVIGNSEEDELRQRFISHIENQRDFINSVENDALFYGKNDIKVKEPYPVAIPNLKFLELYDFIGNIFETQDTPFTYNYIKNNELVKKELRKIKDVFIDYNCPGGGLQRTEANWPPEYMGQVPAFLRNQDIGFRIVIGTDDIGTQKHKFRTLSHTHYSESAVEEFTCITKNCSNLLNYIHLEYVDSNNKFERDFFRSKVFFYEDKSAVVYTPKNITATDYKESILLVQNKYNVFTYHLVNIASIRNSNKSHSPYLKMCVRNPIVPKDLNARRKMQSHSYSDWIDMIELVNDNSIDTYIAYPIDILNGYFQITGRNVRYKVRNGQEYKKHSSISDSYIICFNSDIDSQNYKSTYYGELRNKLGVNFFLPDWIDIVDFIKNISINMSSSNVLDIETVMAAISTIDTADLHEQINKKILNTKGIKI